MSLSRTARGALYPAIVVLAIGCHEPDYTNEVVGNGQGGVEIRRIPKDSPTSDANSLDATIDQRIDTLEEKVRQMNAEIARLKRMKAAGAATMPG